MNNIETELKRSAEEFQTRIYSEVPVFVPKSFSPNLPESLIRARIGTEMMQIQNPLFVEKAIGMRAGTRPTGLEPYTLGEMSTKETVRYLANEGNKDEIALQRAFPKLGLRAVSIADRLLEDGMVDTRNAERDFRILMFEDISAGTIVARLRGAMSSDAEAFRDGTHRLIGNATTRYKRDEKDLRKIVISLPKDPRDLAQTKTSLNETLGGLSSKEVRGWNHMVRLFGGKIKGPHARLLLNDLRSTFLPA